MNKEIGNFMRVASVAVFLSGCAKAGDSKVSDVPIKETPALVHVPTNTNIPSTLIPDFIEVANPTPTPEVNPFLRGEIDFGKEGPVTINLPESINKSISASIMVYPDVAKENPGTTKTDNELQKIWFDENFHPGQNTVVTEKDLAGNIVVFMHDGYWQNKPLEAEAIRAYLEGYKEKTINDPNHIKYTMQSLIGTNFSIIQEDKTTQYKITAIVQIPQDQVSFYDSDTKNTVQNAYLISQNANKTDGATEIIGNYMAGGNGTAISICGWGIVEGQIYSSQTRYTLFFEPVSP